MNGSQPSGESEAKAVDLASYPYLRRLERLVRILIGRRLKRPQDIWQLQLDLLELQRDIQRAIGTAKKRTKTDASARADLEALRSARWHTRRFGDAIAWLLLGLHPELIYPLAQNEPTSVAQEDHGGRGMIGAAIALSNNGWGFPLLHDITDCLRIGDITLIKPDRKIQTVEVKTRLLDKRPAPEGKTTFEYKVTVLLAPAEDLPASIPEAEHGKDELPAGSKRRSPEPPSRVARQVRRLHVARTHQESQPGTVAEVDSKPFFKMRVTPKNPGHFASLRRVVRRARLSGYASASAENTFFYAAFYRREEIGVDTVQHPQLEQDLLDSGILFEEGQGKNDLVIHPVPSQEGRGPQLFLPYYLYSLPQTSIIDILHGRLIIFILINSGRIIATLEEEGYKVAIPSGRNDLGKNSLIVSTMIEDRVGGSYQVELHGLQRHVYETIYEFRSVRDLIEVAAAMRDAARIAVERNSATMFPPHA